MERIRLHHNATTLDIMDRVLNKGIVVEPFRDRETGRRRRSTDGIGLFGVDAHIEVITDLAQTLRNASGA
jgi:hypothetical protein